MKKILFLISFVALVACSPKIEPDTVKFVTHISNTNGSTYSYHPSVFYGGENVEVSVYSNKFGELYTEPNENGYGYELVRGAKMDTGYYKYSVVIYYNPLDGNYKNSQITVKLKKI